MPFRKIVICASQKDIADKVKRLCAAFFAKHFPKKDAEIEYVPYNNEITKWGVDFVEHLETKRNKRYFNKAKAMAMDKHGGGGTLFLFVPKMVDKLGMNHAIASLGVFTKDHKSVHGIYLKLDSAGDKPDGADKVRKWFCKRVESQMKDNKIQWSDIIDTINMEDILLSCYGQESAVGSFGGSARGAPEESYKD